MKYYIKNAIWMQKGPQNFIFYILRGTVYRTTVCIYLLSDFLPLIFAGVAAERNMAQKLLLQWATLGWNNANRLCPTLLQSHLPWITLNYFEERHLSLDSLHVEFLESFCQRVSAPASKISESLVIKKENEYIYKHRVNIDKQDIPGDAKTSKMTP